MSIKKELQEYYWTMKSIERLEKQLIEAEAQSISMSQAISDEPRASSGDKDKICSRVVAIIEYQEAIKEKLIEAYLLKTRIEKTIAVLPAREQHLIRLRYIDRKSFEEIAFMMAYSWRQIHRLHDDVLRFLDSEKDVIECHNAL